MDRLNRLNHRSLGRRAGTVVFADPLAASRSEPTPGEMRWQTVGNAGGIAVLFVVNTGPLAQPDGRVAGRIISVEEGDPA